MSIITIKLLKNMLEITTIMLIIIMLKIAITVLKIMVKILKKAQNDLNYSNDIAKMKLKIATIMEKIM